MSTRQLRRLQQQREQGLAKSKEKEQDEEEIDEPPTLYEPKVSLFASLATLEDEEDNDEFEQLEFQNELTNSKSCPTSGSGKRRKSKKKLRPTKNPKVKSIHRAGGDDIERVLKQLDIKGQTTSYSHDSRAQEVDNAYERICSTIRIQGKHLKVSNEMRNLFGRAAVANVEDSGGTEGRDAQHRQQQEQDDIVELETALKVNHPAGKGLSGLILRRNFFIQGQNHWSMGSTTARLTMEVVHEKPDGTVEFRYVHNEAYQDVQKSFRENVEIGDPQILVDMLVKNPDQISLLIQVSRIAKELANHALASDLLERALFFLGKAATSHFNSKLSHGKARLNFARPENRELWLAGYHYIKSLMMKGTYRTALEWAKLLLSLDPQGDHFCMRLLIHNLALRAQEHQWLCDLYSSGFHKEWSNLGNSTPLELCSHTILSWALAALHIRNLEKAREVLLQSIAKLPWLFKSLFTELNLALPPMLMEYAPKSKADALLSKLYISQTKDLWNTAGAISLLTNTVNTIMTNLEIQEDYDFMNELTLDLTRFIYLDNTPEFLALVPGEHLHRSNNSDSDPIPPDENIFSYEAQRFATEVSARLRPGYLVIGRWNPIQDNDGNPQFTLEGIAAEIRESGNHHGSIAISTARRLLSIFWTPRSSDEDTDGEETETGPLISNFSDLTIENNSSQPQIVNREGGEGSMTDAISFNGTDAVPSNRNDERPRDEMSDEMTDETKDETRDETRDESIEENQI